MDYEDCKKYGSGGWIKGAIKHPGALTAEAKKAKMGVQEFAHKHEHDSGKTGQRARLAVTLSKMKHASGGSVSALDEGSERPETIEDSKPLSERDDPWNNGGVEE